MEQNKQADQKINIVATALAAGTALAKASANPHAEGDSYVLIPSDHKVEYLKRPTLPFRMQGTVKLMDTDSFIAYWDQQKTGDLYT